MPVSLRRKIYMVFFTMLAGAFSAEGANIEFKSTATADGPIVLLGDVAEITGSNAATLSELELFPVPSTNGSRIVRASFIRQQLELHGISGDENQFTGASMIRIVRARTTAKPSLPTEPAAPQLEVVFAKRSLGQGETIREADVELRSVDKLPPGVVAFTETKSLIGQETTRAIAIDQLLDARSIRKAILVTRGQTISVTARGAGFRVRTTAKALEDGTRGDTILVESLDTRQKYSVVVTDLRQVEVAHAARTPNHVSRRVSGANELNR